VSVRVLLQALAKIVNSAGISAELVSVERLETKTHDLPPTAPPKFGQYLLYLFLSRERREDVAGDLQEEYPIVRCEFGRWGAWAWYWSQVIRSIQPLAWSRLIKLASVAKLLDLIRRWLPS
jgi:hypothetical protein